MRWIKEISYLTFSPLLQEITTKKRNKRNLPIIEGIYPPREDSNEENSAFNQIKKS